MKCVPDLINCAEPLRNLGIHASAAVSTAGISALLLLLRRCTTAVLRGIATAGRWCTGVATACWWGTGIATAGAPGRGPAPG